MWLHGSINLATMRDGAMEKLLCLFGRSFIEKTPSPKSIPECNGKFYIPVHQLEYTQNMIWETSGYIEMKLLWQLLLCLYLILDPSSNFHQRTCHRMPGQGLEDASASQARQERQQKCLEAQGNHHDFKRLAGLAYLTWDNACMCVWLRFDGTSCIYIHTSAKRLGSW